ncbi:hypothetical protein DH86_00000491 [Scytalidium sp. 3C]|nr:hypothetical protein DH86_00000491 [Scytalidium sp. 3C]
MEEAAKGTNLAENSALQNRYILVFTVATIFYLPMGFVTHADFYSFEITSLLQNYLQIAVERTQLSRSKGLEKADSPICVLRESCRIHPFS